jgi:hypothetical protein
VSSGVSTLSWLLFAPSALLIGFIARHQGIQGAGWLIVLAAFSFAGLVARTARNEPCGDEESIAPSHLANLAA